MAAPDEKVDPRSVIERIRTEDYLLDIDQESDRVRRGARSLHKKLNSALDLLSKDLYSKKSHFILELIQNADDNEYAKGAVPHLTLNVASSAAEISRVSFAKSPTGSQVRSISTERRGRSCSKRLIAVPPFSAKRFSSASVGRISTSSFTRSV